MLWFRLRNSDIECIYRSPSWVLLKARFLEYRKLEMRRYLLTQTLLFFSYFFFFLLALRLVSGLPMCVCLFFCIVCRKLSVIQWQFTAGSSHAPFLLPHLETPSCESSKSQVPCFTSAHRSLPGSFCIALFRFAVFRSVQFRWFIYLVFLSSSIIKLRLCAVRCFFIARQSEEHVRMRTCFKEPSMTMTTWTLCDSDCESDCSLGAGERPECELQWGTVRGVGVTNTAIACQCSYNVPSTWPTLIRHGDHRDGCRRLKIVLKFYNYRWSEDKLQLGTILGTSSCTAGRALFLGLIYFSTTCKVHLTVIWFEHGPKVDLSSYNFDCAVEPWLPQIGVYNRQRYLVLKYPATFH